jgi:hypothetical protein
MASPAPFSRNAQAARAHAAKSMLLPLPRSVADDLALQMYLALDALRRRAGSDSDAQKLTRAMLLSAFLVESGYGAMTNEALCTADALIAECFAHGRACGIWRLDETAYRAFAAIVGGYDRQLQKAPLWALTDASERLQRLTAGEPLPAAARRHA